VLVKIQSRVEAEGPWDAIDGWSSAELDVLPRVDEFVSLQHIAKQGVWLRVDHIVHTPNNVRPISATDERPYQAILFVTWISQDAVIAPREPSAIIHWNGEDLPPQLRELPPGTYSVKQHSSDELQIESERCIRRAIRDRSGTYSLPVLSRARRRWRQ
jgi:hypothetical protein